MRKTRNPNPKYTEEDEDLSTKKLKLRPMDGMEMDHFQNLHIQPTKQAMAPQTNYNKFKRIIMLESQWRDENLLKKAVIRLAKKHWAATPVKKLLFQLKRFQTAFSKGNITIRPLINYPWPYWSLLNKGHQNK